VPEVSGYRQLNRDEITLINGFKQAEESLLRKLERLAEDDNPDPRWLAIAKTHFEEGFMALIRAVAKPTRTKLQFDHPEDKKLPHE